MKRKKSFEELNAAQQLLLEFRSSYLKHRGCSFYLHSGEDNTGWASLMPLFERPWFSRVWNTQEVMLSRHFKL